MNIHNFKFVSSLFQSFLRPTAFFGAGALGLLGCESPPLGDQYPSEISEDVGTGLIQPNQNKTGFDVTVGLGKPGADDYVSRVSAKVGLRFEGKSFATLEIIRETTAGNERGEFYFVNQETKDLPNQFFALSSASQVGRVINISDTKNSTNLKKYVDVAASFSFTNGQTATEDFRTPFLKGDENNAPIQLKDFLSTSDKDAQTGMEVSRYINVIRYASRTSDEPSWSVICSTPAIDDGQAITRVCTLRQYKKNVAPGVADSSFIGIIMTGKGAERCYTSLSLSFASGDENPANRSKNLQPISVYVSGVHAVDVNISDHVEKKQGIAPQHFQHVIPMLSKSACGSCGLPFSYSKNTILKDPLLRDIRNVYVKSDYFPGRLPYYARRAANNLPPTTIGDDIVTWILDGDDTL